MTSANRFSALSPLERLAQVFSIPYSRSRDSAPKASLFPEIRADLQHRFDTFPLSDIQEDCLIGCSESVELGRGGSRYYFEVELENWDEERFQTALQKLIDRHEMLRAVHCFEGHQRILEQVPPYELKVYDVSGGDPVMAAAKLQAIRREMISCADANYLWPLFEFRISLLSLGRALLHVGINPLIADGRSLQIIFDELGGWYHDATISLLPLELSFRDYVGAAQAFENSDTFHKAEEYWSNRFAALPPSPELPLAVSPASILDFKFARHQVVINPTLWRVLRQKGAEKKLSPTNILLAAYAEVLTIWSKTPHFTLNLAIFNRFAWNPQVNNLVGNFTLVNLLEVNNSEPQCFAQRARVQQEQFLQDLQHLQYSGVRVRRELIRLQGRETKAVTPVVFTSLLDVGSKIQERASMARLGKIVYSMIHTPQVYLNMTVREENRSLVVELFVVEEVFPKGLVNDLLDTFQTLLAQLGTDELEWTRTLPQNSERLLPDYQISLLQDVNNTATPISKEFLHTLFLRQVEKQPENIAVCTPNRRLSYGEVYSRACRIEQELLRRSVKPNKFVGIVMEKGWEQIVAAMGILFAGGAYIPVDPELPPERLRYLIENSNIEVVLTQSSIQHRINTPTNVELLVVDKMEPLEGWFTPTLHVRQKPEDFAYMIYTSGSTGQPKGVIVDHRGAVNTLLDINDRFGVGPADRVLALSRFSFDLSVYDIFGLLAAGGTVVLPEPGLVQNTRHWVHLVTSERITVWNTVPSLMGLLVDQAKHGEAIGQSLRVVLLSGDWIPLGLPSQIRELLPKAIVVSLGGATEASIWSIVFPIQEIDPKWKSIPYGKPIRNQSVHVLSHAGAHCPIWVPGQLHIGGLGLAKGYWRDAEKNAASFLYNDLMGERLYRTGDWGRYLPDGNIEFLGREDCQVKIQGYRIELGEIESKLIQYDGVADCVVVAREDLPGTKRLVAYIIPKSGADLQITSLRKFLLGKLPDYMVPFMFLFLQKFPLTANGKLDRKRLPAPARLGPVRQE